VSVTAALEGTAAAAEAPRRAWVEQIMGMPISVHVRGHGARSAWVEEPVQAVFADLRSADARFSSYREDSELRRLQRGEVSLAEASDELREVERLCRTALVRSDGAFDAWACVPGRPGLFDPTGLVKGWAVARAAARLDGLSRQGLAWAVNAGGDVLARCASSEHDGGRAGEDDGAGPDGAMTAREVWHVGIEDPTDGSRLLARVPVRDGAVATSGSAARGAHILDPRTGAAAKEIVQATVIGPSLLWADVWATTLVALGPDATAWTPGLHGTSGLLAFADGTTHRWSNAV
jgi:thiamine biosynthesis lipoprotein